MAEQLANLAISTLAGGGMDNVQTTLTVSTGDGAKFPSTGDFRVTCEDEIMICTSRSGDVLTVTRHAEGTSVVAHTAGRAVAHTLTVAGLGAYGDARWQALDATLTALAGANWAADSLAIGTGSDTVGQVTFAANTFPAKDSSSALVAKTISDFILTLMDDADAGAARATLGAATYTAVFALS